MVPNEAAQLHRLDLSRATMYLTLLPDSYEVGAAAGHMTFSLVWKVRTPAEIPACAHPLRTRRLHRG